MKTKNGRLLVWLLKTIFMIGIIITGNAQPVDMSTNSPKSNFFDLKGEMDIYFRENPKAKGYKQWERKKWFLEPRLSPHGKQENLTNKTWKAYRQYRKENPSTRSTHGEWNFIGPTAIGPGMGRVNGMAFHPTDANIVYVGSSNGGIWKTADSGLSWINITPDIPLLAIADLALDPNNPQVIYAITGDGDPLPGENSAHSQAEVSSIGVLKSTNGGASWNLTPFSLDHPSAVRPTKLLMHPTNGQIQFVVGHHGILRTQDGWQTMDTLTSNLVYDIEFKPGNPNTMYFSNTKSIYKSINGGDSWFRILQGDTTEFADATRIEIAVAPSNSNMLYALGGNFDEYLGFYASNDSGEPDSWQLKNTFAPFMIGQAPYNIALVVDPTDHNTLYAGMVWLHKSENQGSDIVFQNVGVHADLHDLQFAHGKLWAACDGGVWQEGIEGGNFIPRINGLAITEVYRIAGTAQNTNTYFAGTQDNGTLKRLPNNSTVYFQVNGGDGMTCEIDYLDQNNVFTSTQNGRIYRSTSAGSPGTFGEVLIPGGESAWITPFIISKANTSTIYVGKDKVWRISFSGLFPATYTDLGSPTGENLNVLAQGTDNPNRLYSSDGPVLRKTDDALIGEGPAAWTTISGQLPDLFITGIAIDPNDADRIFISCSGYMSGLKIFRSTNGGNTWTNISGSLPNVPANCIEFHDNGLNNNALYVGTDIGVFYRDDDIGDWIYFSNSMPAVTVNDLFINTGDNTIVAATYGRGLWQSDLFSNCPNVITLSNPTSSPLGGTRYYSAGSQLNSNVKYRLGLVSNVHYQSGTNIILTEGFQAGGHGFFEAKLGPCLGNVFTPSAQSSYAPSGIFINETIEVDHND